ncbi:phage GP46 family protein [Burkholderia multivorans]|uniref:phage GP46 family protein n=1 Tax=Burkholderia multivorans TaxID=87883 RepID=UPI000CFFA0EC|nr:phage GP46 family protein [Burkholderia multivorans]MCO1384481.1 phage GP46 family protein [Burkholderia multivorans]MCO1399881.1 phage GP46 family protein [Burkholderia multivorans]MDN7871260.1 phage GP46 family protein [Burkholderia multivorans]MDN7964951.1 phage GP46 family protein [Burkholderia multivorans]MDN7998041.1 phage GP46 family protein [Burkholderia multivorans]
MSDIKIVWDAANARGDWALIPGDIATGDDLETALLFSLFTDREAAPDDAIPDGSTDRRGWWGDDDSNDGLGPIGSRLWLLSRRTSPTDQTLRDAYDYIVEAIQWLIDTGVVARFDVAVQWVRADMLGAVITAWPPGGGAPRTFNWAWSMN